MAVFFYNKTDEDFGEVIRSLKGLPQVKAPDNFEFNLMVKIKNGEYKVEPFNEKQGGFNFGKTFVPAAAIIFSTVILFFVFFDENDTAPEYLMQDPPQAAQIEEASNAKEFIAAGSALENGSLAAADTVKVKNSTVRIVVEPNDVVTAEKVELPFDDDRSQNLDEFISGDKKTGSRQQSTMLAGGGRRAENFEFNGFLFRTRDNRVEYLKERMDSLKKIIEDRNKIN